MDGITITGINWGIGAAAVLHFILVSMGGLAPLVIFIAETFALRKNDADIRRMAKLLLTLSLEMASIGGIFGAATVVLLVGLRPAIINLIVNIFFWFLVLQLVCYIAGLAFQFAYYFSWDKPQGAHRVWGVLAVIFPLIPFIVFSAGTSFMSNPGNWIQDGSVLSAVFNPTFVGALLHRAAAGIGLLGVFVAVLHAVRGRNKTGAEQTYFTKATSWGIKLALIALEAQIVLGIVRIFFVRPEGQKMIMGGPLTIFWILGIALGLTPVVFLNIKKRGKLPVSLSNLFLLVLLPVLGAVLLMSVTRSLERGPFSIPGVISRSDEIGTLPKSYQTGSEISGEKIFGTSCLSCHPGLAGDAIALARQRYPDTKKLSLFLRNPATMKKAMPPYQGSDDELKALIGYVMNVPANQVTIDPAASLGK